ncbi:MAG TPA: efflux transporter outer membrane subunit [Smithellaceae bacterium]|jgi:multidrug efflux system outer membrane protein|nr:efflux transporter outer membrane subunit [Syntrophaceae bacterium]NMC91778.1 efflux transporter outer membrane subunit [Smithella sp.]HNV56285.1 efflux transporter outer membrane subunit [Smithellaceae bacterium]MBP8665896.1 efflux transporter outer membrane subunit [Syntrophaceae bacterium]MBP9531783.1 efflux transporter outer membrane subunit [Syntrophaceae bacterium]
MNKKRLLILMVLLAGCTLAPKYDRPEAPVPKTWPSGPSYQDTKQAPQASQLPWRDFITDPRLREVIAVALANNRDLRVTGLNVEKAKAMFGINRASLLPIVNATGNWYQERVPADLSSSGKIYTAEKYSVNLGLAAWEIDFFGRIRSLKDAALEQYLATDEARRSAQILLVATVTQAYLALAADREALQLVASTLEAQEAAYNMIRKRHEVGMASELDLRRSQTQVETARGDVARYTQLVAQDENGLNLLVGSSVRPDLLPRDLSGVTLPRDISAGLSSDVLLGRPDVLAAEHFLKAANANIGAARAALFPRISLTTSFGTASADLSGLFKGGSDVWTFAPQIVTPIFDPRLWYAYDVTKIEKEISIAQYEKSIQTAFREVADALAEKGTVSRRVTAQQSLVDAMAVVYRLSEMRYEKGIDSYLSVLDAQRSLYGAQQGLILLRLASVNNIVTLYKTLGGGASS